jgi:hypothetical protein
VQGQQIARPEAALRCSECDGLEMARRGGEVQARRRHDVRGGSVDDKGDPEEQPELERQFCPPA